MPYIPVAQRKETSVMKGYVPISKREEKKPIQPLSKLFGYAWEPKTEEERQMKKAGFTPLSVKYGMSYVPIAEKKKEKPIPFKETLKYLSPQVISEAGEKVIKGIGEFTKTVGQDIARSFAGTYAFITEDLSKPPSERPPIGEVSYTPKSETEKKIFGTDQPVNFRTRGEEFLMIGGEDFKNKWGSYAIPLGMFIAGLDVTLIGWGKKDIIKGSVKAISKTDDVAKITKALKPIFKGSDEEIKVLAKSLKLVNKEDNVLKIITQAGKAKVAPKITPKPPEAIKKVIPVEKGIIPPSPKLVSKLEKLRGAEYRKLYPELPAEYKAARRAVEKEAIPEIPEKIEKLVETPLQKIQGRFTKIYEAQKEKVNIKPVTIKKLSERYKSVLPDDELLRYENQYAQKRLGVTKGSADDFVKSLENDGVRKEVIDNLRIKGHPLTNVVKIKREITGEVSAIITKQDLDTIRTSFKGKVPTEKWVKKVSVEQVKKGVSGVAKLYEVPQLFFERHGLKGIIYDPIRQSERVANELLTSFTKRFEDAGLFKRGSWFTADRFALKGEESKNIGKYYLSRQGKGFNVALTDLSPKEKKFVEIFDGVIRDTEKEFYRIAKLNGKTPGVVKNYAPIMTSKDIKLIDEVGDFDFIFRKHPAFASLKERAIKVPPYLYEQDYREVAARWLDGVSKFNGMGETTPKIKFLIQSDEYKNIVGSEVFDATNHWLKQTLNPNIVKQSYQSVNFLAKLLRKVSATASLGLNYASVAKQALTQIPLTIIDKAPPKLKSQFAKDFGIIVKDLPSIMERKGAIAIADMQGRIGRIFTGPLTKFDKMNAQRSLNALLDKNYNKFLKGGSEISPEIQNYILQKSQDTLDLWYGGMTKAQLPNAFRAEVGKLINMFLLPLTSQLNGFYRHILVSQGVVKKVVATAEVITAATTIAYLEQVISKLSPKWSDERGMVKDVLVSLAGNIPIVSQTVWSFATDQPLQITAGVSGINNLRKEITKTDKEILTIALRTAELAGLPKAFKRMLEGAEVIKEGGVYDKNGKLLFKVEDAPEQVRSILRGKWGSLEAQKYWDIREGAREEEGVVPPSEWKKKKGETKSVSPSEWMKNR